MALVSCFWFLAMCLRPFPAIQVHNREKCEAHTKYTTGNTIMEKSLLWAPCLGIPVKLLSNGIAEQKQQSNLHTQVTY